MRGTQALQGAHLNAYQVGVENAHQDVRCTCRVGQWAEDVEDGAHAQFTAHGRHIFHGGVVVGREHEANAGLFDAARNGLRLELNRRAHGFQNIGAARFARHTAIAVLAHPGTRGSSHKHGASGDVESVAAVAPGANDVEQMGLVSDVHRCGELAHDLRRGSDLADGFLLDAQAQQQCRHHDRRHLAIHDAAHEREHLVVEDFAVIYGARQRLSIGDGHKRFGA